jgi:CPA1 family monovalent cation:H+ antiporter
VLATLLLGILVSGEFSGAVVLSGIGEFLIVFFGGVAVGWILALITGYTLGGIESDAAIEITLTTILAYLAFIIAEHVFHVSGIMAVVAAGLVLGSWGKSKISPSTSEFMEHFWEYLAFLANTLIFLMVGLQIDLMALWQSIDLIAIVVGAMLISREVVIFTLVPLVGKLPNSESIGMPFRQVMYWGGLRGAIALAIVLSLPDFEVKDTLIAIVMGAVLFTLVVQGLSIEKLVKILGLNALSSSDNLAKLEGDMHARQEGLHRLKSLVSGGLFSQRIADNIREKCERNIAELDEEIKNLNQTLNHDEKSSIFGMRCLAREKTRVYELFSRGLINEWAFRELDHTITVQLEDVRHNGVLPAANIRMSLGKAMDLFVIRVLESIPGLGSFAERLRTSRIIRDYDVSWGRYRSANSVLHSFDDMTGEAESEQEAIRQLTATYEDILATTKAQIEEVAEQYPEFVETMQEQLGQRLLLVAENEEVEHAAELGMIQEGIASKILKDQHERLRQLKQDNISAAFEIEVSELLRKVPLFKGLESEFDNIGEFMRRKTVPKGTAIIKQGNAGDSLFLIARGIANVLIEDNEEVKQVATLYAGDFFGEAALLHNEPRNATAVAATPCSLYELKQEDLNRLLKTFPLIREAFEQVDRERLDLNTQTGYVNNDA